jgi:fermentation-respiration switch protein FrsA (DUF1100 family)
LEAEAIAFSSQSGSVIHGWLSRASTPLGSILLLPAIRANRLSMIGRAEFLRRAGYSTLLIDFQATGESAGDTITFGWRERLDVLAAVQYLSAKMPGQPVGVIGVSLGGAANRLEMRIGPLGRWLAPALLAQLRPRLGVAAADLRPADHIARLTCPILVIGGGRDQHTTGADTKLLFAAAREPKELWLIPDAAHVDSLTFAGDAYRRRILAFLKTALKRKDD